MILEYIIWDKRFTDVSIVLKHIIINVLSDLKITIVIVIVIFTIFILQSTHIVTVRFIAFSIVIPVVICWISFVIISIN
jgi:hypothetical protein